MIVVSYLTKAICLFRSAYDRFFLQPMYKSMLGYCGKNVTMRNLRTTPSKALSRVFLYDNVVMKNFSMISYTGKFIMKKNSGASSNLVIITGNHQREKGHWFITEALSHEHDVEQDVIVEEDVWLGANVILLPGIKIGRGATVGAGSVCIRNIPPYAIVMGNPAKVVGFNYTPEEIIEHEKKLYPEEERIPINILEKNYNKYYINKALEIKQFLNY
ncbi:MAG: galactoside O-acetyltransferase [Prevotella sp.]|nr:galactoside O-acetyltransferase [Prevotella sp.]